MIKLKHTDGPWVIKGPSVTKDYAIINDEKYIIAESFQQVDKNKYIDSEANAQLISAAPEMLDDKIKDFVELGPWLSAALSDSKPCDEFKQVINKWFERFDTIEKATGKKIEDILNNQSS